MEKNWLKIDNSDWWHTQRVELRQRQTETNFQGVRPGLEMQHGNIPSTKEFLTHAKVELIFYVFDRINFLPCQFSTESIFYLVNFRRKHNLPPCGIRKTPFCNPILGADPLEKYHLVSIIAKVCYTSGD